jgi:hypothetical protein
MLLPFAHYTSATNGTFTNAVEKATIFCFSELNRNKGGGLLRKQAPEKTVFLSKVYYPIWLAPYREFTLLLDGLNLFSHAISYQVLPDLAAFKNNLIERSATPKLHAVFLSNNQNYFQLTSEEKSAVIEGLMNDREFTEEFQNYAKESATTNSPVVDSVLITPALNKNAVSKMIQSVENTRQAFLGELTALKEIIKLLNQKAQSSLRSIREEIKGIEEEFGSKIQKEKSTLDSVFEGFNKEYSKQVTETTEKFDEKITGLQKEIVMMEKSVNQLIAEIEQTEAEIKTSAINKDDSAEQRWKEKRGKLKEELSQIHPNIKVSKEKILEIEEKRKKELFQLKQGNEAKIKEASKTMVELEANRDAEIKTCQTEMEKIEELTANIIKMADDLARSREAVILEFDDLGIRQQRQDPSMFYVPFYLACYQAKANKHYIYFAPSIVSENGISVRLKAVGKTRISQMLHPRSKGIVSILNRFINLLDEDIAFNREISEACSKANTLQIKEGKEAIKSGLNSLKEQGWLSDREFELFSQEFSQQS